MRKKHQNMLKQTCWIFQKLLQEERKAVENTVEARKMLLSDCRILRGRLKENNKNLSMDEHGNLREDLTKVSDASTSDNQIEVRYRFVSFIIYTKKKHNPNAIFRTLLLMNHGSKMSSWIPQI